ncbi:MAG: hypothetical protein WA160_11610 [Pseudobdellovibrio sp.]
MASSIFVSKKRVLFFSTALIASSATVLFFQNCSASKFDQNGASSQISLAAKSSGSVSLDTVVTNHMNDGNLGKDPGIDPGVPVGSIGSRGGADQFKSGVLLPGFTISLNEIKAIQAINSDSANKNVVCKLFARPVVELGQTVSFMIQMFDASGKENFDGFKDAAGNYFKFPNGKLAHIDFIGTNRIAGSLLSVREKAAKETQRLGHAVFLYNNEKLVGSYSRSAEVFDDQGMLLCRTNEVSVTLLNISEHQVRLSNQADCLAEDVSMDTSSYKGKKLCEGFRVLGADVNVHPVSNSVSVSDFFGSKESSAQAFSRLQGAEYCASGRALVSRLNPNGLGSYFVENECLK